MFPTATTEIKDTGRAAIKRDFDNMDSLIGELAVPKETINNVRPASTGSAAAVPSYDDQGQPVGEREAVEPMAPEIAAISGKAIAGTIDTVLSTGFSLYAKAPSPEKYEANDKQLQKLSEAWAAVASKYNYRVEDSPWFHIIALNAGIYIPKFNEAKNDRRFAEMDERMKAMQKLHDEMEARLKAMEEKSKPAA
jgi:hypothetical protein